MGLVLKNWLLCQQKRAKRINHYQVYVVQQQNERKKNTWVKTKAKSTKFCERTVSLP